MARITFNTDAVAARPEQTERPKKEFGLIKKGHYTVSIAATEVRPMKSVEGGEIVQVEFRIVDDGEFFGRRIWQRITTRHPKSAQAEQIGQALFAEICRTCGVVGDLDDTGDLHDRPFTAYVTIRNERDMSGESVERNAVSSAAPLQTSSQTAPAPATESAAPRRQFGR